MKGCRRNSRLLPRRHPQLWKKSLSRVEGDHLEQRTGLRESALRAHRLKKKQKNQKKNQKKSLPPDRRRVDPAFRGAQNASR